MTYDEIKECGLDIPVSLADAKFGTLENVACMRIRDANGTVQSFSVLAHVKVYGEARCRIVPVEELVDVRREFGSLVQLRKDA